VEVPVQAKGRQHLRHLLRVLLDVLQRDVNALDAFPVLQGILEGLRKRR